ncbi:hypothetical protein A8709_20625 [Paenibacillus pectinilyticus]|uniref:Flagellar assembly factor FliW n=1 Tax=Paenibacillus pectinilyticus TaxID=512399 RepID=A0A1C0ZYF8_9BACL|nr:flagellar assembly protein FliW [Paenibacillus pectinilyticus]OCT13152.1 hypothetical protein A8709_20625 [Paenibacillus pectinilyticus]
MLLTTLQFGELTVEEQEIFTFHQGIPGFEDNLRYMFIQPDAESAFFFLQSVDDGDIALVVTNPFMFFPDYDFEIPEGVITEMEIESTDDVAVWSVVTVNKNIQDTSVNLLAPIIVNVNTRVGKQVILHNSSYHAKHKIAPSDTSEAK